MTTNNDPGIELAQLGICWRTHRRDEDQCVVYDTDTDDVIGSGDTMREALTNAVKTIRKERGLRRRTTCPDCGAPTSSSGACSIPCGR